MSDQQPTVQVQPGNRLTFFCKGCDMHHSVVTDTPNPWNAPAWQWNGDVHKPTLSPSVLVTWDSMSPEGCARIDAFKAEHGRQPTHEEVQYDRHNVCHSFVGINGAQPGQIVYLGDCTHSLKGTVVDLGAHDAD